MPSVPRSLGSPRQAPYAGVGEEESSCPKRLKCLHPWSKPVSVTPQPPPQSRWPPHSDTSQGSSLAQPGKLCLWAMALCAEGTGEKKARVLVEDELGWFPGSGKVRSGIWGESLGWGQGSHCMKFGWLQVISLCHLWGPVCPSGHRQSYLRASACTWLLSVGVVSVHWKHLWPLPTPSSPDIVSCLLKKGSHIVPLPALLQMFAMKICQIM